MKVVQIGYNNLEKGTVIEMSGAELAHVRWVRTTMGAPRKDEKEPLNYEHFSVAGRSFTIDSNDQATADLLKNAATRSQVGILTLEATEFETPELDDDGNETETMVTRKAFRFISAITATDAVAYAKNAGQIAQEEAKWNGQSIDMNALDDKIAKAVATGIAAALPAAVEAEA